MESNNGIKIESEFGCKMKTATGYCPRPIEIASAFLSKKWTISIIITIGNFNKLRFNDVQKRLENITAKTLSERLKELEKEKIVTRKVFSQIPPKVEYSLTKKGGKLMKALIPLIEWAEKN